MGETTMTDIFLGKLEEKIMILLAELEDLRFEVRQLKQENSTFKSEKLNYTQKLQELISLLNSVEATEESTTFSLKTYQLEAMQGSEESTAI